MYSTIRICCCFCILGLLGGAASAQDDCSTATPVAVPSSTAGTTVGATVDVTSACGTATIPTAPGVWFSVIGTGNLMTASLCNVSTTYDSQLSVFTDGCVTLTCVGGNDDFCATQSEVSWCSALGVEYLILVHGSGVAVGPFTVDVTDDDCDDVNDCTADSCSAGACQNLDTTPVGQCCAPVGGALTTIDDGNPCTDDTCNPDGSVSNIPNTAPCDDGDICTIGDVCAAGSCVPGAPDPLCTPTLDLVADPSTLPVTSCYALGDLITVRIEMGPSTPLIVGGQFFLEYDPTTLTFISMDTGDPPFTLPILEFVDVANGTIDYAVGVPAADPGTNLATTMAVITFQADAECDTFLRFRDHEPPTLLSDDEGIPRFPILGDLPPTKIDASAPVLTCPSGFVVNADAGDLTAFVTWPAVTAVDSCDGDLPVTCTSAPTAGLENGGVFPPGITTISCDVTNSCGIQSACAFNVEVTSVSDIIVDIELSPTIVAGPLIRCITFELWRCGFPPVSVSQEFEFGGLAQPPGRAVDQPFLIPAGAWECITARDVLHTLRSTAVDFTDDGTTFSASFIGDPELGGHWLTGGNLNDSEFVDILDFALYNAAFGATFADTDCSVPAPHADINGDSVVNVFDFSFIQLNFLDASQPNCCGTAGGIGSWPYENDGPITEISVQELRRMGLGHLAGADLNGDGLVNVEDMSIFTQPDNPRDTAEAGGTQVELRWETQRSPR